MAQDIALIIDYVNKTFDRKHGNSFWIDELGKEHSADTGYALEWWRDCMAPELVRAFKKSDQVAQKPVAVALTMEEWQTVLHWLQCGTDYHMCKRAEVLANCKDHRTAAKRVAAHETAAAEAENVRKIIEATLYPAPPTETE